MLPLLRTPGQKLMFDVHRYSALVSVVAAAVFAGLEVFAANPAPKSPGLPQDPGE